VEYSLPTLDPAAQRWRTTALVTAGVAVLELIVIAVVSAALIGKGTSAPGHARAARPVHLTRTEASRLSSAPVKVSRLPRTKTTVVVLNGNGRTGAAGTMATLVRARGYRIGTVGNAPRNDYARNVIMYRRGFRAEGVRLAKDMRVRVVGPDDGLQRGLVGRAQLTLIVGH
jgi:hypothetical protein